MNTNMNACLIFQYITFICLFVNCTEQIIQCKNYEAICILGNHIILSAIWNKLAQVNFSKAKKLHEPERVCNLKSVKNLFQIA